MPPQLRSRDLPSWCEPRVVFAERFAQRDHVVWLDGGDEGATGVSVLGAAHAGSPVVTADLASGTVTVRRPVGEADDDAPVVHRGGVFERLADTLALPQVALAAGETAPAPLGWFGWFGYELGAGLAGVPIADAETPDAAFVFLDRVIAFDHGARRTRLVWIESDDADAWADELAAELTSSAANAPMADGGAGARHPAPTPAAATQGAAPVAHWRHDATTYARLIGECQAAITRGDAYQLCLTNRVDLDVHPDPAETYLALRASSPSHHGGYLRFGGFALCSASPEQFLHIEPSGLVSTKPMKGTRPRDADPVRDAALRAELLASDKERAENLMIVDLMRNDLGRIAELGSVSVEGLLEVEEYPHVHQLVSTVRARLAPPVSALDVVRAAFPAGSMTGAPKRSAMAILHDLERGPRGVYSGAFGYLGVDGGADLAMVIRSIVIAPSGASIGTGGGITALSVAEEEIEETRVKARALLAALGEASTRLD